MCGIFAFIDLGGDGFDPELMNRMSRSIAHRGPDDEGLAVFEIDGPRRMWESPSTEDTTELRGIPRVLVLGHRRLSIIDLTASGHQPMCNEDGTIWITYNGEVYNFEELASDLRSRGHRFRSRTDTEVILHAYEEWGIDCLQRFVGMWAFALWDKRKRLLFCARDRFGVKPLYFFVNDRRFMLASEIKTILQDASIQRCPNHSRVFDYLLYGHLDHTSETLFQGIHQLQGGEYLTLRLDSVVRAEPSVARYWDLKATIQVGSEDPASRFRELFEEAVRLHMKSDVSVGTCLSGGLDSSAIVCTAKKFLAGKTHKTFSSCFQQEEYDERSFISKVVEASGAEPHYVFPRAEDLFDNLGRLLWHQEEPFGSTSIYAQWHVFRLARENDVTVVLDGQGADEFLAGYHPFFGTRLAELLRKGTWREFARQYQAVRKSQGYSHSWLLAHTAVPFADQYYPALRKGVSRFRNELVPPERSYTNPPRRSGRFRDLFRQSLYQLLTETSLPALLHYEDRNSMAHSIEARVPFLDHRLVEYAFSLPSEWIMNGGVTKVVLRKGLKDILPEAVRSRKDKMGFATPGGLWLRTVLRNRAEEILQSKKFRERGYFDGPKVLKAFKRHCLGEEDIHFKLWRWINVELWFEMFIDPQTIMVQEK
jgi:asparagine synthase (glutamine-hydrolysing)